MSPMKSLYNSLNNVNFSNKRLTQGLSEGITNWSKSLTMADKFKVSLIGILGLSTSMVGMSNAMKSVSTEGWNLSNSLQAVASGIGGIASGAYIGSIFGPWGTVIGGATGAILELISALSGLNQKTIELAKEDLFGTINISTANWKDMLDNLNISINDNTIRFSTLRNELSTLDSTFETSANKLDFYGLKFSGLSQKISEEDAENIKNAIKDMCESSESIIDKTTNYGLELVSSSFKQGTTIAEEEQSKMLNSIMNYGEKQKSELKNAQDNITKTYDNAIKTRGYLTDEEYKYISEQLQKIRELTNSEMSKSQTDIEYYKTLFADKNQKLDEESYSNYKKALDEYHKDKLKAIRETYNQELNFAKNMLENNQWTLDEYNQYTNDIYNNRNNSIKNLDEEILKFTDNVTKSLKDKYRILLKDNSKQAEEERKIIEGILDEATINKLKNNYCKAGKTSALSFNNSLNAEINPYISMTKKIKIDADMTSFNQTLSSSLKNYSSLNLNFSPSPIKKELGGIYSNGKWKNIPQYANGGAPSHGSLVFAGENGPEILGNANGKTEILNQSQIASSIYSAVYSAMSQFSGQANEIDVHVHTDEGTVIDRVNQKTKQTGICPIYIPIN